LLRYFFLSAISFKAALKLTFVADKPPSPRIAYQEILVATETGSEYFFDLHFAKEERSR
jgi:hypothetical protein